MISLEIVSEFVYNNCENVSVSKNGTHFLARCPLCGDSKKNERKRRFNLDYNNGNPIYHCFNCDASGSFLELYSNLNNILINEAKKQLDEYNPNYLIQRLSKRKKDKIVKEIEYEDHSYVLKDCISEDENGDSEFLENIKNILKNFKVSRGMPRDFKVFYAYQGNYSNRIILPLYDKNGLMYYFQGRAVNDSIVPKYKNPTLMKGNVIFNEHKFDRKKSIIAVEGLLDALSVGNQGTAYLGSSITDEFIEKLMKLTDEDIIISVDNDEAGYKSLKKFIKKSIYSKNVKYFIFPDGYNDCDDINRLVTKYKIKDIYNLIVENSMSYMKLRVSNLLNNKLKLEK
jgi:DNA primase